MKILQFTTVSELGGAQSVVIELANSLCKENEVFVVSSERGKMWNLFDKKVKQIPIKQLKKSVSLYDTVVLLQLFWIRFAVRPDIVHLHSSKAGILGRLAFPKHKIVYTYHGFDSIRLAFRKYLPIEKKMQYRCNTIVGVSEYDRKNCLVEGIDKNVVTIHNGVSDTSAEINQKLNHTIQILKNDTKFKVITIARLSPPKHIDLFLSIASQLKDVNFYWVGNNYEYKSDLSNVTFCGELRNAALLNNYADLFILCSNYEGMPMSIIEALKFSRPVISSNVGGISEMLDGSNGFVVENKKEKFCEKILFYKENRAEYDKACFAARRIYEEKFCSKRMIEQYLNIYNKIISKK
ncbi:MAG: glycosyltransferase [Tannerellaceae bacterium]|jgi:glycosyltransferase involved in cell wall biosynthesis|nr:glycosyltransferase [Tannerellaceae bacterium]